MRSALSPADASDPSFLYLTSPLLVPEPVLPKAFPGAGEVLLSRNFNSRQLRYGSLQEVSQLISGMESLLQKEAVQGGASAAAMKDLLRDIRSSITPGSSPQPPLLTHRPEDQAAMKKMVRQLGRQLKQVRAGWEPGAMASAVTCDGHSYTDS